MTTSPLSPADLSALHASPELPDVPAWLDDVEGEQALAWVAERNATTRAEYDGDAHLEAVRADLEAAYDSPDKIPAVTEVAGMLYNFWTDAEHPRGLWRRTTWDSYRTGAPGPDGEAAGTTEWEVLLDLDGLGEAEGTTWVWHGAEVLREGPLAGRRALVDLSDGGSDTDVTREMDLDTHAFIDPADGGFTRGPSKGSAQWADDAGESILLTEDLGEGSLTDSGYPRVLLRLGRGRSVEDAEVLLVAPTSSILAYGWRDRHGRVWAGYRPDFYTEEIWLLADEARGLSRPEAEAAVAGDPEAVLTAEGAAHIDVQPSAEAFGVNQQLLITLREDWQVDGRTYRSGSLLAAPIDDYLADSRDLTTLFEPTDTVFLQGTAPTLHHLVLAELDDVLDRFEVLTPAEDGTWSRRELDLGALSAMGSGGAVESGAGGPAPAPADAAADPSLLRPGRPIVSVHVGAVDSRTSDRLWLTSMSFTSPTTLAVAELDATGALTAVESLRRAPERFDADGVVASQHVAVSDDGTRVPYFQVGRPAVDAAGRPAPAPVLLNAYGGFEIAETVTYLAGIGRAWLQEGGTFVLANIRGGGEYGPAWHRAGLKEHRHRVYEDLAAVARSLTERGVTTPERLGVMGGSNGGLLVGNMLTRYPELFGAVVCEVPLLDMGRYTHLLAGASWAAEYGDPDDPEQWEFIKGFSPFHLLREGTTYPPVLFVTSTRDDRVHPAHARTMAHRMLSMGQDVTYFENSEGGHGRASTNAQRAFMVALEHEFLRRHLG
ncbi:prolyl oligopeptidase family serine peptidase [Actinomyces radicidentis]|uniref:Prolyl oligopeptidase n=1 Tax=Actinomyces radicidentis TaxID=111015 RepID=A0A0X8JDE0_ACTRD|nr:prolyl oligopeptidase family serine peptidase [Actinomyces radicidentis]AMD86829.1 prolyl oligopeptidase [Actinomyces radicidentis]